MLIGDGPLKSQLHANAENTLRKGSFFFPGFINNAEKYMPLFDIYCLASDYEGTPNVIMEALASGLPVISTNVGDVSEIIEPGLNGMILPSNEPEVISQHIQELIINPHLRARFSKYGREKIFEEYDTDKTVDKVIEYYHQMQAKSKKKRDS